MKRQLLTIGCALLAAQPVVAQELREEEASVVSWIDDNLDNVEALIEQLVNINSGTMNHEGVRDVGALLRTELDGIGFETSWVDMTSVNRAGHLVARREGDRGRKLVLIGHLDTVFEEGDPFQRFERQDETWASGPGILDMKSGNVVLVYALKALEASGLLDGAQVRVVFTGDEESMGRPLEVARRDLIEAGQWGDVALGFEWGHREGGQEWATIARRGSSGWRLEVTGRQAHSSQIFSEEVGAGAIFEAARILSDFYEEVRGEEYLTFNAGVILGGTEVEYDFEETRGRSFGKTNVVPNKVVVQGGIRTISDEQLERARDAMRLVVRRHLPHTSAEIEFADGYPGMAPTDGNRSLQGLVSNINQALGRGPMPELDPSRRGAADIAFVGEYVDALAGIGAYGEGGHTPDERLDLSSLHVAIKRAALLIYRLSLDLPITY